MYAATVGDELTFDRILDGLSEYDRASVDRVLHSKGFGARVSVVDVDLAREEGYRRGLKDGQANAAKAPEATT